MTENKDAEGDFTDHAIEVVEAENKRLAEFIGVSTETFGEAVADATFRLDYDYLEQEILVMNNVAWNLLVRRTRGLIKTAGVKRRAAQVWIYGTCAVVATAFIFIGMAVYGLLFNKPSIAYVWVAVIHALLLIGCLLAGMVMTGMQQIYAALARKNLDRMTEIGKQSKKLYDEFGEKARKTKIEEPRKILLFLDSVLESMKARFDAGWDL